MRAGPQRDAGMTSKPAVARGATRRRRSRPKQHAAPAASASVLGDDKALFRLMTWLSPSFPVGAFAYSSGIEWAVEAGDIVDAASLRDWLAAMLADGAGFCDAVFVAQVHRAVTSHDDRALRDIAELAAAFV